MLPHAASVKPKLHLEFSRKNSLQLHISPFFVFVSSSEPAGGACLFLHIGGRDTRTRDTLSMTACSSWQILDAELFIFANARRVETCAESACCWDLWVMAADTDGDNYADESFCWRFVD